MSKPQIFADFHNNSYQVTSSEANILKKKGTIVSLTSATSPTGLTFKFYTSEKNWKVDATFVVSIYGEADQMMKIASADTNTYDLKITNLNSNVITNKTGLTTTTTKVTLDKGVPYSWNITSKSTASTTSTASDTWKFYLSGPGIVNYAPFPADLKTPASGSTVSRDGEGKVTFTWDGSDPDGDTLTYTLYADKTDGKQTPPSAQTDLSVKTLAVALEADTTYYWRVKTSDGTNSSYSIVYSFKTE